MTTTSAPSQTAQMPPGPGVDAQGRPVIDPTANVIAILQAAVTRIDDLFELANHKDDRYESQRRYYDGLVRTLEEQLRRAESARIDAIRAVDVGNVQRAADVAAGQAEQIRQTVAATASAFDAKLIGVLEPIQSAIADLRRAQYETVGGKAQVVEARSSSGALIAAVSLVVVIVLGLVGYVATRDPAPIVVNVPSTETQP
jgi:hypothetical protein